MAAGLPGAWLWPAVLAAQPVSATDAQTWVTDRFGLDQAIYPSLLCEAMDHRENPQAALELLILKTLAAGPNHGFGIALHIEESSSALLRVEEGSLYPALHRLDKAGFIDAEWTVTPNGRRARMYRLTKPGRKRLKDIEESWNTLTEGVRRVLRWA